MCKSYAAKRKKRNLCNSKGYGFIAAFVKKIQTKILDKKRCFEFIKFII